MTVRNPFCSSSVLVLCPSASRLPRVFLSFLANAGYHCPHLLDRLFCCLPSPTPPPYNFSRSRFVRISPTSCRGILFLYRRFPLFRSHYHTCPVNPSLYSFTSPLCFGWEMTCCFCPGFVFFSVFWSHSNAPPSPSPPSPRRTNFFFFQ